MKLKYPDSIKSLHGKRIYWDDARCQARISVPYEYIESRYDELYIFICQNENEGLDIPREYKFGYKYSYAYEVDPNVSLKEIFYKCDCRLIKKEKFEI
jgi:hypothetical protein